MKKSIRRIAATTLLAALILTSSITSAIIPVKAASAEGNIELTRRAASEGMVLMENHTVEKTGKKSLPIAKGETVAMFGRAMIDYVRGGGGSGDTYVQYSRNILQGMQVWEKEGRIKLVPELTDCYIRQVTVSGITDDANIIITDEVWNAAKSATETAVVTIGRTTTEGYDRNAVKGDYYLSDAETALITKVAAEFDNTIVVLNISAVMDTGWIKGENAIPGVDAVLNAWQGGMEGGLATADILVGHVNPSGKLVDTWAKDYTDYPTSKTFKESGSFVNYTEDVFVGYRYFETIPGAAEKVNYPFGYGLSYTEFNTVVDEVKADGSDIVVKATVTNTGDAAGKQVVQTYFTAPRGKLTKPAKELAAFGKTGLLAPGASETVTMRFAISDMSSYDDTGVIQKSAYVMEKGDYTFFVGNSIRDGRYVDFAYTVSEDTVVEQLTERLAPNELPERMLEDGSYVDAQRGEIFDPHYVLHEGVNRVEMENFVSSSGDVTIESYYDDDNKLQYCLAYMQSAGRYAEYSITVPEGMAGRYSVLMCFANGNAPTNDCFRVSVNDMPQSGIEFNARQTGNLDGSNNEWYNFAMAEEAFYINLEEGENLVRFTANKNNPNYEYMLLQRVGEPQTRAVDVTPAGAPVRTMAVAEAKAAEADEPIMLLDVYNDRSLMPAFLDQLTVEELALLLSAQGNRDGGNTQGWGNNMTYGIPLVMTADGPQGIRIGNTCTAWPISTCLAATWDVDLIAEVGHGVAKEAHQNNMDIWLAPGMNIHRDPLCGRNFEYYSEDPLVTGKMAASLTRAVQSDGVAVSLKHFAANNKESNRTYCDSRASERALREIYLRGFEIAVKEGDAWTVMSSYNFINGTEAAENYDLLNGILRGEWGFNGVVETDWGNNTNHVYEVLAGNDVKMTNSQPELLVTAVENGKLSREILETGAQRVLELIMKVNYFHDQVVNGDLVDNVPVTTITPDTRFKVAEGIVLSRTIQSENCGDVDGGRNLSYCDAGAWAQYKIDVEKTGRYDLSARTAASSTSGQFNVLVDGKVIATFDAAVTGGWQSWATTDARQIHLEAGKHVMRIVFTKSGANLNWLQFTLTEEDVPVPEIVNRPVPFAGQIGEPATFHAAMTTATTLTITENPVDFAGAIKDTATFTVKAEGEGLTYRWMYSNNGGRSFKKSTLPGAKTDTVSVKVKAFRFGQQYKCVVTDASGNVAESTVATIVGK